MTIELTPRSLELIAQQQREHGAISPEHLIEQALEAFSGTGTEPSWYNATPEECRKLIAEGLEDVREGRTSSAEEVFREMDRVARQG